MNDTRNLQDFTMFLARKYRHNKDALRSIHEFNDFLHGKPVVLLDTSRMNEQMFKEAQMLNDFQKFNEHRATTKLSAERPRV